MDPTALNDAPDLSMEQITKLLFNNNFLSDIEFHIENKVIYAHSWELFKRSVVFQNQLFQTLGANKLIPIVDTSYQAFYQFIRFLYIDEYSVQSGNEIELLKLARKYKVARLETKLLNTWIPPASGLELMEMCTVDKYTLGETHSHELLINYLDLVLKCENFVDTHPDVVQEVLKFDAIPKNVTEIELFDALVRWMNHSCAVNQIPFSQRRLNFDRFIRLIRFAAMTPKNFDNCVRENRDLFTEEEIGGKFRNLKSRQVYKQIWAWRKYAREDSWETKFTVSRDLILHGVRYGCGIKGAPHSIQISVQTLEPGAIKLSRTFQFQNDHSSFAYLTRNLGGSIKVRPNFEYTIEFQYLENSQIIDVYTRQQNVSVLINGAADSVVHVSQSSANLFELIFNESLE